MDAPVKLAADGAERFAEGIVLQRQGGVLNLTIDRPNDMNRLMPDVLQRLGLIAEALRDDGDTQVQISSSARARPTSCGKRTGPPAPGKPPQAASGMHSVACSAA